MRGNLWAGAAWAALACGPGHAAQPSLCDQLVDEARRAPAATWASSDPLAAWVKPVAAARPSPAVTRLADGARWREKLGVGSSESLGVQQWPGLPVYLIGSIAGTAHCQSLVLVEARPGQPERELPFPFARSEADLCMTRSATFATVLGQPALLVGGAPGMTSPDVEYRMATWTGSGWGPACRATLHRSTGMAAVRRFCAPGSKACEAGQAVAARLAQAYEADRKGGAKLDAEAFNGRRQPERAVAAALNPPLAEPDAIGDMNPPFPTFGADERTLDPMQTTFSNADPRRLPVFVDGRWWLAVVGRGGVGWREGDAVLVALFAPPGRVSDGVASYQFRVVPTRLLDATAADDAPRTSPR